MVDKLNSTDRLVGGIENTDGELRASGSINAGDVVTYDGSETGVQPDVSVSGTVGETVAGVALHDASSAGDPITVAQTGAEVRVNASGGANDISGGDQLVSAGNGSTIRSQDASSNDAFFGIAKRSEAGGEVVALLTLTGEKT